VVSSRRTSRIGRTRVLFLLVVTSITLLTLDFRGSGAVDDARGAASTVVSPLIDAASAVTEPFTNAWNGIFGYSDLEQENEALREQMAEMEGDVAEAQEALRQLEELAELDNYSRWTDLDSRVARVVGGSFTNFENTVQIDRGTDDGVAVGMPVVTGAGLAGRVVATTSSRATVQLITDPGFDIGIRLAVTGEVGVAHGTGLGHPLVVDQGIPVNLEDNVRTYETVTTSGVSRSAFPPDIPVGRVTEVSTAADQLSLVLTIDPLADLDRLTHVRVLLWEPEG
jgi:rod shape-determining protein MreC